MAKLNLHHVACSLLISVTLLATLFLKSANAGTIVSYNSITGTLFREGQTIELNCSTSSNSSVSLRWRWSYNLTNPTIINGTTPGTPKGYWSVLSYNATAFDNGRDMVCTSFDGVNTKRDIIKITIILLPQTPVLKGPDEANSLKPVTWTCYSTGASYVPPNLYWRDADGEPLLDGVTKNTHIYKVPYDNYVYNVTSALTIQFHVIKKFTLECRVIHVTSSYTLEKFTSKNITVFYPPQSCTEDYENITRDERDDISMECCVDANPPVIQIIWLKNGVPIDMKSTKYTVGNASDTSITIRNVSVSDVGTYTCKAINDVGDGISPIIHLFLNARPVIQVPMKNISFNEHLRVILVCNVYPMDSLTEFYWTRNGSRLNTEDTHKYSGGTLLQPNLTILAANKSDIGNYSCVATNANGTSQSANIILKLLKDCFSDTNLANKKPTDQVSLNEEDTSLETTSAIMSRNIFRLETILITAKRCSMSCIIVSLVHGFCTLLNAIMTITIIVQLLDESKLYVIVPNGMILAISELVQIAMVFINGVADIDCNCIPETPVWLVMLIYQFFISGIFIVADIGYLGCKKHIPCMHIVTIVCIHSVIGIFVLPFTWLISKACCAEKIPDTQLQDSSCQVSNID